MRIQDRKEPRGSYGAVPIGRIAPNVMRQPRPSEGGGITKRRTFQPVRRNSYDVHDARAKVFRPIAGGELASALRWRDKLVQTAQEYDDHHKKHGSRLGPIGDTGIRVLDTLLTRCCDFKTGRCEPSIETLMRYTRYARATVVHALARLRKHGFLDWVRRTRRTENERGEGPQVAQETNAYFFELTRLPGRVFKRFKQLLGGRAAVEAERQRKAAEARRESELAATPLSKLGTALAGESDSELAALLDRMGAAIEARDAGTSTREGREASPSSTPPSSSASSVSEQNPPSVSKIKKE